MLTYAADAARKAAHMTRAEKALAMAKKALDSDDLEGDATLTYADVC